jgi:hypothetical protein
MIRPHHAARLHAIICKLHLKRLRLLIALREHSLVLKPSQQAR